MDNSERKKYRETMRRMSQALMDRKLEAINSRIESDPTWYPGKVDDKAIEKAQNNQAYGQMAQLGGMVVGSQVPKWLGMGGGGGGALGGLFGGGSTAASTGVGAELGSGLGGSFLSSGVAGGSTAAAPAGAGVGAYLPSLGTAAQIGGGLGGAYAAYDAIKNRDDWDDKNEWEAGARRGAQVGAGFGTMLMPGIGTAAGAAGGAMWGTMASLLGGGKDKDQRQRDTWRAQEVEKGFLTPDYQLNGFDVGKDGGYLMREGDKSSKPYNVDFNDEASVKALGDVNALATLKANGNEKLGSDIAGYLTNATKGGGGSSQELFQKSGYDRNSAYQGVLELAQKGLISNEKRDAHLAEIDRIFGVKNPNA